MTFVCQLQHDRDKLDLRGDGRVMFVFWCMNLGTTCEAWEPDAGANAALLLSKQERTDEPVKPPGGELLPYLRVQGWTEHDDGVPREDLDYVFDDPLDRIEAHWDINPGTRLGGAPFWPQAAPVCEWDSDWVPVLQLAGCDWLPPPAPSAEQLGCRVVHQDDGFRTQDPLQPKPFAPGNVVVLADGTWGIERFVDFTTYVFLRVKGGEVAGRIYMQR